MYRNTLCTATHCLQKYIMYSNTLCTIIHYVQQYIMYRNTLCTGIHCLQQYIVYSNTLCTAIHYVQQCIVVAYWPFVKVLFGVLANLQKAIIRSSCMSVRPHGTIRLQLDVFSRISAFGYFSKICRENSKFD